jgi:ABC-type transporter Mla maintaining outer membrane lipid asymmetry permease subunit MlaE
LEEDELFKHQAYCRDQRLKTLGNRAQKTIKSGVSSLTSSWFRRYLWNFMSRIILQGLPFHLLAGLGLGAVATYFSFNLELGSVAIEDVGQVQVSRFVLPTFFEQMLSGFGVVLYRALIPLFTCICVAARAGTAVTAYLSDMRDEGRRQWDAMNQFGVLPLFFFLPQFIISFSLGCFILSYLAFWAASVGSLLVSMATNPLCTYYTWVSTYWAGLHAHGIFWFEGTGLFFVKTALSGVCIALISTYYGTKVRKTSIEAMTNLSRANVMNVLVILSVFFLLLLLESP